MSGHVNIGEQVLELVAVQPSLRLAPSRNGFTELVGEVEFRAQALNKEPITDRYNLRLSVPPRYPRECPFVSEVGGRIQRQFHHHPDNSLCLGSRVRLRLFLSKEPSVLSFFRRFVVNFLYAHSYQEQYGEMPFGELAHGNTGLLEDYAELFGVGSPRVALELVRRTSQRTSVADRKPCPCGSGVRLERCHSDVIHPLRKALGRRFFREEYRNLSRTEKRKPSTSPSSPISIRRPA